MSTPSNPVSNQNAAPVDSASAIAAATPWWAPQGSGTPPDSWPGWDTGQPPAATATPASWQPAEPAAVPPPTGAAPVLGRHARLAAGRRPRIRIGVAVIAAVLLGGGAGASAVVVDGTGGDAGARADHGATNDNIRNGTVGVPRGGSFPGPRHGGNGANTGPGS